LKGKFDFTSSWLLSSILIKIKPQKQLRLLKRLPKPMHAYRMKKKGKCMIFEEQKRIFKGSLEDKQILILMKYSSISLVKPQIKCLAAKDLEGLVFLFLLEALAFLFIKGASGEVSNKIEEDSNSLNLKVGVFLTCLMKSTKHK